MKVALCISGELRTFNNYHVIEYLNKYMLDYLNPDIFLSIWDHIGVSLHQTENFEEISNSFTEEELKTIYPNLKGINIENLEYWKNNDPNKNVLQVYKDWENNKTIHWGVATCVPQFYKLYDSYRMKKKYEEENNFKYDIVIKTRPDNLYTNYIDKNVESNTIYHNNNGPAGWSHPNRIYDVFFYGNSETFDKIACLWEDLESLLNDTWDNGCGRLDACRTLFLQSIRKDVNVKSINKRICDPYRNTEIVSTINWIKQHDQ